MKAAVVDRAGQVPAYADFAEPRAQPGECVVTVAAAALSPLARGRASGAHYSAGGDYPFVAGVDGTGRLDDGRRVCFLLPRAPFGAMAERTVVAADRCVALPDALDDAAAAALANPGMASWMALRERARIRRGETVLVNGTTGSAGRLAVAIARHLGAARVVATGRNAAVLAGVGADETIALEPDEAGMEAAFAAQLARGVDIVLDFLWGPSARSLVIAAGKRAGDTPLRYVQIGSAAGAEIAFPAASLRSAAVEVMGSGLGSVPFDRLVASVGGVLAAAAGAGLAADHRTIPLAEVETAWGEADDGRRIVFTTGAS